MRYKDENKKESISNAAIRLINEMGLAESSMSKIAKKAGVSPATIYIYFENKDDMIKKLYLMVKQDMQQKIFNAIDCSMPIKAAFELVLKKYIHYFLNNKDYFLFFEQFVNSPLIQNLCCEESQMAIKSFLELIENGKRQNIFKNIDNYLIFAYTFCPLIQLAKQYFNERYVLHEENIENVIEMSWNAIKV